MKTKKMFSKVFALLLALVAVLCMSVPVFAETGSIGSITIENATIGEKYKVYKVFDLTYFTTTNDDDTTTTTPAYTFTKTTDNSSLYDELIKEDSPFKLEKTTTTNVYNVSLKNESTSASTVASYLMELVNKNILTTTISEIESTLANQEVKFTGLNLGYYFVTDINSEKAAVTLTSTMPNAVVKQKNSGEPTVPESGLKTFDDGTTSKSASIGDTVKYKLTLNTTNWKTTAATTEADATATFINSYTFKDTPTNVKIDQTQTGDNKTIKVTVTVNEESTELKTNGNDTYTKGSNEYKVTFDNSGNMTIKVFWGEEITTTIPHTYKSYYADGAVLTVEYQAEVISTDDSGIAKNSATWNYNDEEPSAPSTPEVKTYDFDLTKVDAKSVTKEDGTKDYTNENAKKLAGAEFSLYKEDGTTLITLEKVSDGVYKPANSDTKDADRVTTVITGDDGKLTFKGLAAGTYKLTETKAPAGYNKLTEQKSVTITVTTDNGTEVVSGNKLYVENSAGSELPSTGGIGTTIFYVVGSIMVAGALILLVVKKRMSNYQD